MFGSKDLLFSSEKYGVAKSLRFRSGSSTYLNRTFGTPTNNKIWTWSAWIKRGAFPASTTGLIGSGTTGSNYCYFGFQSGSTLNFQNNASAGNQINATTAAVFRDPSAWYHIVLAVDTTQATNSNGIKIYINGVQQTLTFGAYTQNTNTIINSAAAHTIGDYISGGGLYFDGYMAEVNFLDGQALTPSSFGFYDNNGIWQPKGYTGTYGTNGFYLKFTDVGATSGANTGYGKDFSGFNTNYWTTNNFGTTSTLATYDSMYDSPVNASNGITGIGNYPTWNPLSSAATYADANLSVTTTNNSAPYNAETTIKTPSSGKWYAEITLSAKGAGNPAIGIGNNNPDQFACYRVNGTYVTGSMGASSTGTPATFTTNDVIGVAFDADNGNLNFYKNGALQTGGFTGITAGNYSFILREDSASGDGAILNCGQRPFAYSNFGTDRPAATYLALNTQNLTTPTITNGAAYMAAVTYQGATAPNTVTTTSSNSGNNPNGVSFQPDLVWIKSRSAATNHKLTDAVRGTTKALVSNSTAAETTDTNGLTAFTASGFTVGSDTTYNNTTGPATYVAWEWKANGAGSTGSGSGLTSITNSANASAGFSITTYTGNGSAGAYFNHGLGAAPGLVIVKQRTASTTTNWAVWHTSIANTNYLLLNTTAASTSGTTYWNSTTPDSTKVTLGTAADVNTNTGTYVAWCWAPIAGFSAMGSYTGNGSADGPFIYTGFRPRWVLRKRTDTTAYWILYDTSRNPYNVVGEDLYPNDSLAEANDPTMDILSNGFKIRGIGSNINASGGTYIYAAFAENPFKISRAR